MQNSLLKKLHHKAKEEYQKRPDIVDIILFGSAAKGKEKPSDFDILIIFNRKVDRKIVAGFENATGKSYKEFFETFPAESILQEGISLVFGKKLSELYGLASGILFRYELRGKNKSERMQFYYALYGRNSKGMLEETRGVKFSETTVLVPTENGEKFKEFLENSKIDYFLLPILFPATYKEAEKLRAKIISKLSGKTYSHEKIGKELGL